MKQSGLRRSSMKIVIVGDGKVGLTLTEQLSAEGHDIVIIDRNQQVLRDSQEAYDVMVVTGNGASMQVLKEAGQIQQIC